MAESSATPANEASNKAAHENPEEQEITEPHEHDVLCGRGGSINSWKGNERFRTLVERRKRIYLTARFKREKRLIASSIVSEIQGLDPPGRFLSRNPKKGTWFEIDDDKARDKVSQALRENAPSIRAEIETEIHEQRAEIQRTSQQQPTQPPNGAPQNPYYSNAQGWGYFSYYGYAQQPGHPGGPPPPVMPPPPPPPGYAHAHPPHPAYHYPNGVAPHQHISSHPSGSTSPCTCHQHGPFAMPPPHQPTHSQEQQQQQQQQQPFAAAQTQQPTAIASAPQPAKPAPAPAPQLENNDFIKSEEQKQQEYEDDKSIFDALSESMSAILSPSLASWTKEAFSIGGGMSIASTAKGEKDGDKEDTATVASKPIKYVHQPEDRSVASQGSKARSVHFKDERSLSGRSLDNRRRVLPPRIMHSSQISYPRRPKMLRRGSNGASVPRGATTGPGGNAPLSSVHLNSDDGMISLITTEGMNSIMEDGPFIMEEYEEELEEEKNTPNEEHKDSCEPLPFDRKQRATKRSNSKMTEDSHSSARLTAVANQIVNGSMGSWDASTLPATPRSIDIPKEGKRYPDTMAVEIEGQEVQLVDDDLMDIGDNSVVESRIPRNEKDEEVDIEDWPSRVGSCHSWLPEPLGNASFANASFFSYTSRGGVSPASSMDMDVSSNTDPFSCAGSIGGASLCKVFDAEAQQQNNILPSPHVLNQRVLNHMPSWERSLRSKSPLSLSSGDLLDDQSLVSKNSEKMGGTGGSVSSFGSSDNNERTAEKSQALESFRKE